VPALAPVSDPFGIWSSFHDAFLALAEDPLEPSRALVRLWTGLGEALAEELSAPPRLPDSSNEPGQHPAVTWATEQARLLGRYHTVWSDWLFQTIDQAERALPESTGHARFWATQLANACAPANSFWTNPEAVRKCVTTQGESVREGLRRWLECCAGNSWPPVSDLSAFQVGRDLATTPGFVVFRNELMELILYSPTTESAYATPVVLVSPWINKYYILDLSPKKSLIKYLVDRGFTVFCISWRNPSSTMRRTTFEDYVFKGAGKAIDVARSICGVPDVHAVGYCIGGTALASLMAWFNAASPAHVPVRHWSAIAALTDFADPGELAVYAAEKVVSTIEDWMRPKGFLEAGAVDVGFRLLHSALLLWRPFVQSCLCGNRLPRNEFLYWSGDGANLPEAMCSFYLREFLSGNKLAKRDALVLNGRRLHLGRITQPLYAVASEQDHLVPWKSAFRTCNLIGAPSRFALSSEGHVTGVVNPPSEKSGTQYRVGPSSPAGEPDAWRDEQDPLRGSWWEDWAGWLSERCGPKRPPPALESSAFPPLGEAPGSYVLERPAERF
jgi:polyhydroxyalkanoate synthase